MPDQVHAGMARLNPAKRFGHPMDVVEASAISADEKLAILAAWEMDERALQRAEDEGMSGGEHAHLQRVQEALRRMLANGSPIAEGGPT